LALTGRGRRARASPAGTDTAVGRSSGRDHGVVDVVQGEHGEEWEGVKGFSSKEMGRVPFTGQEVISTEEVAAIMKRDGYSDKYEAG